MTSKNHNQKAAPKPAEKPEAKADELAPAAPQADEHVPQAETKADEGQPKTDPAGGDTASDQTDPASEAPAADPAAAQDEQTDEPAQHVISTMTVQVNLAFSGDLTSRLSKTVNGMLTTGNPETVHALHKVEMLVAGLKTCLPSAIEASDGLADEGLKGDLIALLANL